MQITRQTRSRTAFVLAAFLLVLPLSARADKIASFDLPRLNSSEQIKLDDVLGKGPVLVVFWASWCKPCLMEAPHLVKLYQDLHPRGLEIIGVNIDRGNPERVKATVAKLGLPYPVVTDAKATFASKMQVRSIPASFLIDSKGEIVKSYQGFYPGMEKELAAAVTELLPAKKH